MATACLGSSRFLRNRYVAEGSTLNKCVTLVCLHASLTNRMIVMMSQGKVHEMKVSFKLVKIFYDEVVSLTHRPPLPFCRHAHTPYDMLPHYQNLTSYSFNQ